MIDKLLKYPLFHYIFTVAIIVIVYLMLMYMPIKVYKPTPMENKIYVEYKFG